MISKRNLDEWTLIKEFGPGVYFLWNDGRINFGWGIFSVSYAIIRIKRKS